MNASKEECHKAIEKVNTIREDAQGHYDPLLLAINEFLGAALKRLPSEEAIVRDNLRKAGYNANRKTKKTETKEPGEVFLGGIILDLADGQKEDK